MRQKKTQQSFKTVCLEIKICRYVQVRDHHFLARFISASSVSVAAEAK